MTARLSRAREQAADRAAVAVVTGSPAVLATSLTKLDRSISDTPNRDLREVSGISSLSILPLEPEELEKVMLGPDGNRAVVLVASKTPVSVRTLAVPDASANR